MEWVTARSAMVGRFLGLFRAFFSLYVGFVTGGSVALRSPERRSRRTSRATKATEDFYVVDKDYRSSGATAVCVYVGRL